MGIRRSSNRVRSVIAPPSLHLEERPRAQRGGGRTAAAGRRPLGAPARATLGRVNATRPQSLGHKTARKVDAYVAGRAAWAARLTTGACPYRAGSVEAEKWAAGWRAACDQAGKVDTPAA